MYCDEAVKKRGFEPIGENWPSVYFHKKLKLLLVIYVDDLKMAGPTQKLKEGWSLLPQAVDSGLYLGCEIHYGSEKMSDGHEVRTVTYDMTKFLSDCVNKCRELANAQDLKVIFQQCLRQTWWRTLVNIRLDAQY